MSSSANLGSVQFRYDSLCLAYCLITFNSISNWEHLVCLNALNAKGLSCK